MLEGIDVHDAQGAVDWHRIAGNGKAFAFIRAAYGDRADSLVVQNFVGAKTQGLRCGLYHFYRVTRDADAQADCMIQTLKDKRLGFGSGDFPPILDIEDNPHYDGPWDPQNNQRFITGLLKWINRINREFNCTPMVYTRASFWKVLGEPSGFNKLPLWVAHYQDETGHPVKPNLPTGWNTYAFWQYSEIGHTDGVGGGCDMNRFSGDAKKLATMALR